MNDVGCLGLPCRFRLLDVKDGIIADCRERFGGIGDWGLLESKDRFLMGFWWSVLGHSCGFLAVGSWTRVSFFRKSEWVLFVGVSSSVAQYICFGF